jgi:hypothetical protein
MSRYPVLCVDASNMVYFVTNKHLINILNKQNFIRRRQHMEQSHDAVSLWILWLYRPFSMMCNVTVVSVTSLTLETARKVCCSTVCHYVLLCIEVLSPVVHYTLVTCMLSHAYYPFRVGYKCCWFLAVRCGHTTVPEEFGVFPCWYLSFLLRMYVPA